MKYILRGVLSLWILLLSSVSVGALDAATVNVAAYASYSAYREDKNVELTREELGRLGFTLESFQIEKHNVLLGKRATDHTYFIAIAGTESKASLELDLLRDFVPYHGENERQVHDGFYRLSQNLRVDSRIDLFLKEVASNPKNRLIITGHSLGGAVAIITAKSLDEKHDIDKSQIEVVTFGAPMPGNTSFIDSLENLSVECIAIEDDIIPSILQLVSSRYRGSLPNTIRWESDEPYTIFAHSMQNYLDEAQRLATLAYEDDKHVPSKKTLWIAYPKFYNQARFSKPLGEAFSKQVLHGLLLQNPEERAVTYVEESVEEALRTAREKGYEEMLYIVLRAKTIPTSEKQSYSLQAEGTVYDVRTGAILAYQDGALGVDDFGVLVTTGHRIANLHTSSRLPSAEK